MKLPTCDILPSLLSADFTCLGEALDIVSRSGSPIVHLDVMDAHFVPNLTFGPPIIRSLRAATQLTLDAHLMIADPDRWVDAYIDAGADMISVHVEASQHLHRTLSRIRDAGRIPGVALNPATSLSTIEEALSWVDFVMLMTVNPGFGGQRYITSSTAKIRRLVQMIQDRCLDVRIEVDGGIGLDTISEVAAAGVNLAVAGSAVFCTDCPEESIRSLRRAMIQSCAFAPLPPGS